jgi:hypothetical protein
MEEASGISKDGNMSAYMIRRAVPGETRETGVAFWTARVLLEEDDAVDMALADGVTRCNMFTNSS